MWIRIACTALLACGFGVLPLQSSAEDPKPKEPEKKKDLEPTIPASFRAFLVTDGRFPPLKKDGKEEPDARNRTGKIHCLVCENGLAPVVAIFVRGDYKPLEPNKDLGELISQINRLISIPNYRANKLAAFVMFLKLDGGEKDVTVKTKKDDMEVETKIKEDFEYPDDEKRAD